MSAECYPKYLSEKFYDKSPIVSKDRNLYEWSMFRDGTSDSTYGGGFTSKLEGWTGSFALNKGYFACFDHR